MIIFMIFLSPQALVDGLVTEKLRGLEGQRGRMHAIGALKI